MRRCGDASFRHFRRRGAAFCSQSCLSYPAAPSFSMNSVIRGMRIQLADTTMARRAEGLLRLVTVVPPPRGVPEDALDYAQEQDQIHWVSDAVRPAEFPDPFEVIGKLREIVPYGFEEVGVVD